jgi:hypothetical protein
MAIIRGEEAGGAIGVGLRYGRRYSLRVDPSMNKPVARIIAQRAHL